MRSTFCFTLKYPSFLTSPFLFMLLSVTLFSYSNAGISGMQTSNVTTVNTKIKTDTTIKDTSTIAPYNKLITDKAIVQKGLLNLDQVGGNYYLEIPENMLEKDILVVNRISKAATGNQPSDRDDRQSFLGYAGDEINENVIRFSISKDKKSISVYELSYSVYGLRPGDPMYENVMRSNLQPIYYTWSVKAVAQDSSRVVDITSLLKGDEQLVSFDPQIKALLKLNTFAANNSYIESVSAYPGNITLKMVKTYTRIGSGLRSSTPVLPGSTENEAAGTAFTYELCSTWVLLPESPMKAREWDQRVGYFNISYLDYGKDPQAVTRTIMATRWRLEPKPADITKYLAGELVEPVKPIIFYIDPTTPQKWVPYLMQGVNDWQKAFERAGFKNAIMAKRAPTRVEDPSWSLDDARYSAIVYMPSTAANAQGQHISDPRTGEIMEAHINWYHNVMTLLQGWYIIQAGALDPRARKGEFDDELMGQLIRFVTSHEVGHSLGLRHNFIASNSTPVERLRDKAWVEKYGHTASIMDYARFNYVAQPEDSIGPKGIFPRINDYDEWAITWGYKWYNNLETAHEKEKLSEITTASQGNPRLRWGPGGEAGLSDPREQTEDLGDDQMKANTYGMKNLKYVARHLPEWVIEKGHDYSKLTSDYTGLVIQFYQYNMHAINYIGGFYEDQTTADDGAPNRFAPAPLAKQKEALDFVDKWLLHRQEWLFYDENLVGKIMGPANAIEQFILGTAMDELFDSKRLLRIASSSNRYGVKGYQLDTYLEDLKNKIWTELDQYQVISEYRREVQNKYINKMSDLMIAAPPDPILTALGKGGTDLTSIDTRAIAIYLLGKLKHKIDNVVKSGKITDSMTLTHLNSVKFTINKLLNDKDH